MKAQTSIGNLLNKLTINKKVLSKFSKGMYLKATNNAIELRTTSVDTLNDFNVVNTIQADIFEEGYVYVHDTKQFYDTIKNIGDNTQLILLEYKNNFLILKSEGIEFKFKADTLEIPKTTIKQDYKQIKLNALEFKQAIKKTLFCTSKDTTKPIITGLVLNIKNNNSIDFFTTDGFRLALSNYELIESNKILSNDTIIIPNKAIKIVEGLVKKQHKDSNIIIQYNDCSFLIKFEFEPFEIEGRLLQGNMFDYKKLIPTNYNTQIKVNRKEILNAISMISSLIPNNKSIYKALDINIDSDKLIVSYEDNKIEIHNVEIEGSQLLISFNDKYLIEGLKSVNSEFITMDFTSNVNPTIVKTLDDNRDNHLYLLLPVRKKRI